MVRFIVLASLVAVASSLMCEEKLVELVADGMLETQIADGDKCEASTFCTREVFTAIALDSIMITSSCDTIESKEEECRDLFAKAFVPMMGVDPTRLTVPDSQDYRCVMLTNDTQTVNQLCCCKSANCNAMPTAVGSMSQEMNSDSKSHTVVSMPIIAVVAVLIAVLC